MVAAVLKDRPLLTRRQRQILVALVEHFGRHQVVPSYREIGRAVGIRSPSGVMITLKALAKKGYVELRPGLARGYRLADMDAAVRKIADRYTRTLNRLGTSR